MSTLPSLKTISQLTGLALFSIQPITHAQPPAQNAIASKVESHKEQLLELYQHLHANPELSFREEQTSITLATRMRGLGFDVTERVGGYGVVCVFKNGPGKTLLVRTDMDGLPVEEKTGLPFASKAKVHDDLGREVAVMHACAHDLHMAAWYGAAKVLVDLKARWSGTLVFIAQPAEERGAGALSMLKHGLYSRFPRPSACIAIHNMNGMPSGTVGTTSGVASANTDSVDITVHGLGGHGAMPDKTRDPVVLASQLVIALQTIRSRELPPQEPAVITVGSIHGGSKHNIIPDEVRLQLTVRTFSNEARTKTLDAIARIAKGLGIAAGLPEKLLPEIHVFPTGTPMLTNDPELTSRLRNVFTATFGEDNVLERRPMMGGEDFSRYGMTPEKTPLCLIWIGGTPASVLASETATGVEAPSLHSPFYHPDAPVSLPVAVTALTSAALELLPK